LRLAHRPDDERVLERAAKPARREPAQTFLLGFVIDVATKVHRVRSGESRSPATTKRLLAPWRLGGALLNRVDFED
jgi:hypothetical protein